MTANDARPRTLGDILDRTIATYGRMCVSLFAILALVALPVALVGATAQPFVSHAVDALNGISAVPAGDAAGRARAIDALTHALAAPGAATNGWFVALQFALTPLAQGAAFAYVASAAAGAPASIVTAYRMALRRWLPLIAVTLAFIAMAWLAVFACIVVALVGALVDQAFANVSPVAGSLAAVVVFVPLACAFGVVLACGYFAWSLAIASVVTEEPNAGRAIVRGFRRTLEPAVRRRALLVAPVLFALGILLSLGLVSIAALLAAALHADIAIVLLPVAGIAVFDGVRIVFTLLYVEDVRVRREGADLLAFAGDATADDRALIDAFLARRAALDDAASAEIAARIAARVRPKLRASFHYLDDVALLEHLARSRA